MATMVVVILVVKEILAMVIHGNDGGGDFGCKGNTSDGDALV